MQGGERERASEREREEKGRNGGTEREKVEGRGRERGEGSSNLVFNVQSTCTVISGRWRGGGGETESM